MFGCSPSNSFRKPVLFLLGQQDSEVGHQDTLSIMENFPGTSFAVLDKAGHSLGWEQPILFKCPVINWL